MAQCAMLLYPFFAILYSIRTRETQLRVLVGGSVARIKQISQLFSKR